MSGSREDAEDLVQETYARVLSRPRLLRNEDDLGYLLRALRNTFLTSGVRRSRRLRPDRSPSSSTSSPIRGPREPQAALEAGELYAAIAALPDDFRDVLVAVDVTGLSYKEAAQALRIREGTVMSRLYRARQQVVRGLTAGVVYGSAAGVDRADQHLSPDDAWSPSARSRVTVSVVKSFGETPAHSITSDPR